MSLRHWHRDRALRLQGAAVEMHGGTVRALSAGLGQGGEFVWCASQSPAPESRAALGRSASELTAEQRRELLPDFFMLRTRAPLLQRHAAGARDIRIEDPALTLREVPLMHVEIRLVVQPE